MGAFTSTETCAWPDLAIDVDLAEGALQPKFESTGRGGMALYASEDVALEANQKTRVPTGVTPHIPFMLVGMVVGPASEHIEVSTQIVDCDTSTPIAVDVTFRPTALNETQGADLLFFKRGDKVALLVVLPIARPDLRIARPARDDDVP
jgi:dUTPase